MIDNIEDRVIVSGYSDNPLNPDSLYSDAQVKDIFLSIYSDPLAVSFRTAVNQWLLAHEGENITITWERRVARAGVRNRYDPMAGPNHGNVFIDFEYYSDLLYVTKDGSVVRHTEESILLHELGHALSINTDDLSYSDLRGANLINMVDSFYSERGIPLEAGYVSRTDKNNPNDLGVLERFPHDLTRQGFPLLCRCDSDFLLGTGGQHGWHERFHRISGTGLLQRLMAA